MSQLKAYILERFAHRNPNYSSWMNGCPCRCEVVDDFVGEWEPPPDAGIIITHQHFQWETICALRRIRQTHRIPILIISDGVLEYRNTFENPTIADGSMYQPVIGHKFACIGRGQARVLESWGNVGICEVVGMPRLDSTLVSNHLPVQAEGVFRLLVATATTPAFCETQRTMVLRSLRDLKQRFAQNPWINQRPVEVEWRLTDGLDRDLGISPDRQSDLSLGQSIELADAVITTPSTLFLESVIRRRPTALLDYTNSPKYVSAAWNINAPLHLPNVLEELASPPPAKLQFQRASLHDQLECATPATPRMHALIKSMVRAGIEARRQQRPLVLPARVLSDPQCGLQVVESEFDRATLFPDNRIFENDDSVMLQSELTQAISRLEQLPKELTRKMRHIDRMEKHLAESENRIHEIRVREQELLELLEERKQVVANKTEHIEKLSQLLQDGQERISDLNLQVQRQQQLLQSLICHLATARHFSIMATIESPAVTMAGIDCPDETVLSESTALSDATVQPEPSESQIQREAA